MELNNCLMLELKRHITLINQLGKINEVILIDSCVCDYLRVINM